jgi:Family of unknown function (DUF6717)
MEAKTLAILSYWSDDTWAFDVPDHGIVREMFGFGIPEILDEITEEVPEARDGFRLTVSTEPVDPEAVELEWVKEEFGGNWYRFQGLRKLDGWLPPVMCHCFEEAPKRLYLAAKAVERIQV